MYYFLIDFCFRERPRFEGFLLRLIAGFFDFEFFGTSLLSSSAMLVTDSISLSSSSLSSPFFDFSILFDFLCCKNL
ncbi:hypothetical protein DERP_003947 [Dermatophagoides pteronyssinus]|uniref:Uncharacterized protein n=1 Tax=Dermatophagoides pteronyssinus TaxID=6956 RepID=A0ABQ8J7U0_DERPT|nr:hypothetical protein DERP_003947 [Dermatophagoides pteronyssinus]